jgi:hypothetical protein
MRPKLSHVAAAAAVAGFLGFGGMSLAYAQDSGTPGTTTESPSTTTDNGSTTTPPNNPAPQQGTDHQGGCPNMGGSDSGSSSTEGTSL